MKTTTAKEYLEHYYNELDAENKSIIEFLRFIPTKGTSLLDYGCGACLMPTASIYSKYTDIYYTDADWKLAIETVRFKHNIETFDWNPLFIEMNVNKDVLRSKMRNIYLSRFPAELPYSFDTILCFFCLDMASKNWLEFEVFYKSLLNHLNKNGWLIIGVVTDSYASVPGENEYPCLNISRDTFLKYHKPTIFETIPACADRGYSGMLFSAEKL